MEIAQVQAIGFDLALVLGSKCRLADLRLEDDDRGRREDHGVDPHAEAVNRVFEEDAPRARVREVCDQSPQLDLEQRN
jgi:hypothetical protein